MEAVAQKAKETPLTESGLVMESLPKSVDMSPPGVCPNLRDDLWPYKASHARQVPRVRSTDEDDIETR